MLFGFGSFAELPFSTSGPPVTYVSVTGNALTLGTGTVTVTADVDISVVKNTLAISIGSATISANANVSPTGSGLTLATGTLQAITWSAIDPGVSMTWTEIDTS